MLDLHVDCESCGCHIKQEDTRQGIQPLFELALYFTERMDYAALCFVISCIGILALTQKNSKPTIVELHMHICSLLKEGSAESAKVENSDNSPSCVDSRLGDSELV